MSDKLGQFRLMEKIEDDVLGELFCAAWQRDGSEEIVLLRLFELGALEPETFLERIRERRSLVGAELGEQLATSRRLGVVGDRAYDLFPYVSGHSLASLIRRTERQRETVPLEVALYVAGRLATGLGIAYRQEIEGECLVHGFVVPWLVMISEEGGVTLGGLEVAPALRDFRGTASTFTRLLPYMSPELRAGEPLHPSDDVYSLGALLYELLTLRRLASASDLRVESKAIPSELQYFLARSVAERYRRIQSVVEWLRELKALVVQEGWAATAQDLSAFVAEVDERVHPPKPDTSEFTASDRETYAKAILRARAAAEAPAAAPEPSPATSGAEEAAVEAAGEKPAAEDSPRPAKKGGGYETTELSRDLLRPLEAEGRMVKTSHVKRASDSWSSA